MAIKYLIMKSKNLLEELYDEQLSSVEFVQDYLQLHFEDKTLTCYIWPVVVVEEREYINDDINYKNILCSLITNRIDDICLIEHTSLTITLSSGAKIVLSLDKNSIAVVGEIAILSDENNNWSIFD